MLAFLLALACGAEPPPAALPAAAEPATSAFTLRSPEFAGGAAMPAETTCDGHDASPALAWSGAPEGTRSFALVVDDPDAPDPANPRTVWVHWVVYDLPADLLALAGGGALPAGAREGKNDWGRTGYGGPCPPIGRHRYFHKLYALDVVLGDLGGPDKGALERAMQGHVLGRAELVGTYEKR